MTEPTGLMRIIRELSRFRTAAEELRDLLLSYLVMIGETPAPTFEEEERIEFLCQRFAEANLQQCSTDEVGNALAVLPGEKGKHSIVLVAHADTIFSKKLDRTVSLRADRVIGPGVGDNGLGLATLLTLPALLEKLDVSLESDLVLVAATRSLGRGNLEGLRFFLDNYTQPIRAGVCVEGAQLGRLSYASIGMLRGEITVTVPEAYDWTRFGTTSAIEALTRVINAIAEIPIPQRPRTRIIIGSLEAGSSFNTIPTQAVLRFEARSESAEMVDQLRQRIEDIIVNVSSRTRAHVTLDILARRKPGGMGFGHPLVRCMGCIIGGLQIEPRLAPSTSELSAFISRKIPAVTIGISTIENVHKLTETVHIAPISTGIAQLIGLLLAVDGGFCDGN